MTSVDRALIAALADASRTFADSLDAALAQTPESALDQRPTQAENEPASNASEPRDVWDPETDAPLVPPRVKGTREEQDWCSMTYLGGIWAINQRYARGADRHEVRRFAVKAGYSDGRAVTAWSKGRGGTRNDDQKQRWITEDGKSWVRNMAEERGVRLPSDLLEGCA